MSNIIQLKDKNGTKGYPLTLAEAVIGSDGENLEMMFNAKGTEFAIDNTKKSALILKEMYGKTVQDGVPTISTPIPLIHAKNDFINNGNAVHGGLILRGWTTASGEVITDRLFLSHGKFYVERKIKEVNLSDLVWADYQTSVYRTDFADIYPATTGTLAIDYSRCSQYVCKDSTLANMSSGNYKWASASNPRRYYFKNAMVSSLDEFKASIVGQKLAYVLAEPYIEEVSAEEVLNLISLESYDGATTLSQTSDAKGEMEITVAKNSAGGIILDSYSASIEVLSSFIHIVS